MSDANAALSIDPESYDGLVIRCLIQNCVGEQEKALADISRAIALQDDSPFAFCTRADVLARLSRYSEALRDATRALVMDPNVSCSPVSLLLGSNRTDRDTH